MNDRSDNQELLDDVLAEASPPEFRSALLGETLRQARQRRRWRQARRAGGALLALLLVVAMVRREFSAKQNPAVSLAPTAASPNSYVLIETQPLPAGALVTNRIFSSVPTITSSPQFVTIATTSGHFRIINDEQLLSLLGPVPVALVRTGPNSEELVFANPADQKRLVGNP